MKHYQDIIARIKKYYYDTLTRAENSLVAFENNPDAEGLNHYAAVQRVARARGMYGVYLQVGGKSKQAIGALLNINPVHTTKLLETSYRIFRQSGNLDVGILGRGRPPVIPELTDEAIASEMAKLDAMVTRLRGNYSNQWGLPLLKKRKPNQKSLDQRRMSRTASTLKYEIGVLRSHLLSAIGYLEKSEDLPLPTASYPVSRIESFSEQLIKSCRTVLGQSQLPQSAIMDHGLLIVDNVDSIVVSLCKDKFSIDLPNEQIDYWFGVPTPPNA